MVKYLIMSSCVFISIKRFSSPIQYIMIVELFFIIIITYKYTFTNHLHFRYSMILLSCYRNLLYLSLFHPMLFRLIRLFSRLLELPSWYVPQPYPILQLIHYE
uniref:Uncharacterized protein n=1 Tax=Cacopsylla melanoneura TaxID=428564 RepID=A0A8D9BSX3_9HEMI